MYKFIISEVTIKDLKEKLKNFEEKTDEKIQVTM